VDPFGLLGHVPGHAVDVADGLIDLALSRHQGSIHLNESTAEVRAGLGGNVPLGLKAERDEDGQAVVGVEVVAERLGCLQMPVVSSQDPGQRLRRPLVDPVSGSRHKNMKELRPGSTGRSEIRVLFAFDRVRRAILLVGGDKSGDWSGWYDVNIPIADNRFDEHQEATTKKQQETKPAVKARRTKGTRR